MHLNLGTAGTDVLGRNIGPHGLEFCFEDGDKAVADIASLSLKHGSHFKVHRVEIRAWGRPHLLPPKVGQILPAPVLDQFGHVGRDPVLLEGVQGPNILLIDPRKHFGLQYLVVVMLVDHDTLLYENEGAPLTI